jgi:hypothetical protein
MAPLEALYRSMFLVEDVRKWNSRTFSIYFSTVRWTRWNIHKQLFSCFIYITFPSFFISVFRWKWGENERKIRCVL